MLSTTQLIATSITATLALGIVGAPTSQVNAYPVDLTHSNFLINWLKPQNEIALKSGTDEIRNPLWLEVPGTRTGPSEEFGYEFSGPFYVEVNGLTRRLAIATADIQNPDTTYSRIEVDCSTYQYRALHFGDFGEGNNVSFITYDSDWSTAISDTKLTMLRFICNR